MNEVGHHLSTAVGAYRRFVDRSRGVDPSAPTRLAGWVVRDLIDHVGWAAAMEADAVRTAVGLPIAGRSTDLGESVDSFARICDVIITPDTPITIPAGTVPAGFAAPLFAFEAALHAADLDDAAGGDASMTPDEVDACGLVVGPMLDLLAAQVPDDAVVIDLVGLEVAVRLTADPGRGAWVRGTPDPGSAATTTISGSAEQIVLFAAGRIDASALRVDGVTAHADHFKRYFPGP